MSTYNGNGQSWGESEWQEYVNRLLSVHHSLLGESYQPVPDMGGDHGLEGFSSNGIAYQAYADQDSKSTADRKRKQKEKITSDLPKLEKYATFWEEFLQGLQFREWILVVPILEDKDVVKHARTLATKVKAIGLVFITSDFQASVKCAHDFTRAAQCIETKKLSPKSLQPKSISDDQTSKLLTDHPDFVQHLNRKLAKLFPSEAGRVSSTRDDLLKRYLASENLLDELRDKYPALWEEVDELIQSTGESVRTEGAFDTRAPRKRLTETQSDFAESLESKLQFLRPKHVDALSWGAVASWLGECPLDFPEVEND